MNNRTNLWRYACQLYDKPQVQSACMTLQDDFGINTPLVLYSCWRLLQVGFISKVEAKTAKIMVDAIDVPLISSLRKLRRILKNSPTFHSSDWQDIRSIIAEQELKAERLLLADLESLNVEVGLEQKRYQSLSESLAELYPVVFTSPPQALIQRVEIISHTYKTATYHD